MQQAALGGGAADWLYLDHGRNDLFDLGVQELQFHLGSEGQASSLLPSSCVPEKLLSPRSKAWELEQGHQSLSTDKYSNLLSVSAGEAEEGEEAETGGKNTWSAGKNIGTSRRGAEGRLEKL